MAAPKGNKNHYKHGLSHTRIDNIYKSMVSRCYNKNNSRYKNYGGRGINVCYEWLYDKNIFFKWALENGYKDNLTIDRIDVDRDYCPNNCKWSTYKEQANNKSNNRLLLFNGVNHTISEWSSITGIKSQTIWARLKSGWSVERALSTLPSEKNYH